jgi:tRNA pseudouridine55 synthase
MSRVKPPQQHGLLVIHKPKGPTSARCLEQIKRVCGQKKIGHAGTLDPMAEGVLLVLLGQFTKIAQYLTEGRKVYCGSLILGVATDTYDAEGEVVEEQDASHVTPEAAEREIHAWREQDFQIIPPYSAAKHEGKPLYKLSREGKETPVKTKPLLVTRAEVLEMDLPRVRFRVECGAGTYVRSLVHSLGMRLGCGAVLTELIRERSHPFDLGQAHDLDEVLRAPESLPSRVLSLEQALPHWPAVRLTSRQAAQFKNGAQLACGADVALDVPPAEKQRAVFLDPDGIPLGLVETQIKDGKAVWAILRGMWNA